MCALPQSSKLWKEVVTEGERGTVGERLLSIPQALSLVFSTAYDVGEGGRVGPMVHVHNPGTEKTD